MIATPQKPAIPSKLGDSSTNFSSFFIQFVRLAGPFWHSERKEIVGGLTLGLLVLTVLQVGISVVVTEWSAGLFNALERRSMSDFVLQIFLVVLILLANMGVTVTHMMCKRRLQLDWRGWLTDRLLGQWMKNGRHYQVTHMPGKHDNPDGRIAEDIRIATEYAIDLCHSLFYCLLLLFSFTKILWSLSGTVTVSLGFAEFAVPGHLVWIALVYAAGASYLGWRIGRPLILATDSRQTEEANFRFGLVRAREHSEAIALVRGETDERRRFIALFRGIVDAWQRQTTALAKILFFSSGYSVLSMAFPTIVAAPRYISGSISLGALVQSAQAFQQMAAALSWPVDNVAKVAEWRASVERVLGLVRALHDLEEDIAHIDPHTILVEKTEQSALKFHDLSVAQPNGEVIVAGLNGEIHLGERVLLSGDPAVGARIFKAIAGLWPWGCGTVELPKGEQMFFIPSRPYWPIGTLRGAVSYPASPDIFGVAAIKETLRRVGLEKLTERLDDTGAWEKILSPAEQQRLGFARLLLHRPNWILLQEALDSLDAEEAKQLMLLLFDLMPNAAVLIITNQPSVEEFRQREIALQASEGGMIMKKETWQRREQDRRGNTDVGWSRQILGVMRKDRRKNRAPGE